MSDHDEKQRRWGFLKQKILANRSANNHHEGTKGSSGKSKAFGNTLARFSRMKHEKPGTCLQKPAKNTSIPLSLLCTQQKFKLLDDDTFSTRPLIGFASRQYTKHHYSEVWLAEYINATRKKAQVERSPESLPKSASTQNDGCPEKPIVPQQHAKDTGGLGEEIDRLSKTLNKVSLVCDTSAQGGRSYHVSGFDVQSTTSHTSSIDTSYSEFSFEADFTQLQPQQQGCGSQLTSSNVPVVDSTPGDALQQQQEIPTIPTVSGTYWNHAPNTVSGNQQQKQQHQQQQQPRCPDRLFQAVLSELDEQEDMMLYQQSLLAKHALSRKDSQGVYSNHATTGCQDHPDRPDQVDQSHVMEAHEPNIVDATLVDDRHPFDEDVLDPSSDEDHLSKPVDEICFSSEESNIASEITTEAGLSLTGDHLEAPSLISLQISKQGAARNGNTVVKKAKCVVVYDKHFSEKDNKFYDDVPANVKEIVDRLEVLRRLQEDHAEKFGYKDFLPILAEEQRQDCLDGYREYKKESDNQFLHMLSFSFESGSLVSVSSTEEPTDPVQEASV